MRRTGMLDIVVCIVLSVVFTTAASTDELTDKPPDEIGLLYFNFSPTAIYPNGSESQRTVTVTMRIVDETGISSPYSSFRILLSSPSDEYEYAWLENFILTSGDEFDGVYTGTYVFDTNHTLGMWEVNDVTIYPKYGPQRFTNGSLLQAAGYNIFLWVGLVAPSSGLSVGEITAPVDPIAVGEPFQASATFTDKGIDNHVAGWDWGDMSASSGDVVIEASEFLVSGTVSGEHTYSDPGVYEITLTVANNSVPDFGQSTFQYVYVVAANQPPTVGPIIGPTDPVQVNTLVEVSAEFTDADESDTHTAEWSWGDGTTSAGIVDETTGSVSGGHEYTDPGVYTVTLTVTDGIDESDPAIFEYVTVYDPSAGYVAGVGSIYSEAGNYALKPEAYGRAYFGFWSRYRRGAHKPSGLTAFYFRAGCMFFVSWDYDWLVVAGQDRAKYKGTGTINCRGNYGFMLTAVDGDVKGGEPDKFRIKIWDKDNGDGVVYDNKMGAGDDSYDTQEIACGNIVVRTHSAAPSLLPEVTSLPTPFPSPANPEVWIPYRLGSDSEVVIRIHDVAGRLVRTLDLGYRPVGFYDSRSKAAYWDGHNAQGEVVASGIYFYTFQAGDFAASRKLLIIR